MTTVYLVRHGETEWNAKHRMQGRSDILLSERGREQASFAAKAFESISVDAIYTSPLARAEETALAIRGKRKIPLIREKGIIEIDLGKWEGYTPDDMDIHYPGQYDIWRERPGDIHIDGGETFRQVQERAVRAFSRILEKERGKTVLFVSHMGCISTILFSIARLPLNDLWKHPIGNCALCRVDADDEGHMEIKEWGKDDYIPERLRMKKPFGRISARKN